VGRDIGIIGAGVSGLSLSLFLDEEVQILEQSDHVGGFAASFSKDGFTFDYGPHILFSKNPDTLQFLVRALGSNVHRCRRNNRIAFKERLIKYPFENDLKSLPLEDNFECLYHYVDNPFKNRYPQPQDLKEWLLKHFGQGICDRYLFPYNEKVWNIPVEELSMSWADRIPKPPLRDVIKSALGYETEGYLHQLYYYYPLQGGYQAISEALVSKSKIVFNTEVMEIFPTADGRYCLHDGQTRYHFDEIVSTMPIQELLPRLKVPIPDAVRAAVSRLIVNPIIIVSLGLRGRDENQFTAVYVPESGFWVNRISFPCTFSPGNGPDGHFSLQAEITCRKDSEVWQTADADILNHVLQALRSRGILTPAHEIVVSDIRRKEYAYVVYDRGYEENIMTVRKWFAGEKIHLLGRFSYFEYINIDGAVDRALELANRLNPTVREPKDLQQRAERRLGAAKK
jgi:protoporphyrinogen oxidase